jgi:uncharacterized protein YkwD
MFKGVSAFIWFVALSMSVSSVQAFAQSATQPGTAIVYLSAEENQFYLLVNRFRANLGLPELRIQVTLEATARAHTDDMNLKQVLAHEGPLPTTTFDQRIVAAGYTSYTFLGENVACGNADAVSTLIQWAASPGHLVNLINPHYHHMGIARSATGDGKCPYYWTNDFGSITDGSSDPVGTTDIAQIKQALLAVAGSIGTANISLPIPGQPPEDDAPANPQPAPAPAPTSNANLLLVQCSIPSDYAKGIFGNDSDAILDMTSTQNSDGTFSNTVKVTYMKSGMPLPYAPLMISSATIVKNAMFPFVFVASPATNRTAGFTIQFNTQTQQAQLDSFMNKTAGGNVSCSVK